MKRYFRTLLALAARAAYVAPMINPRLSFVAFALCLMVSGCATFPELDATITEADRSAPYPKLANLDSLLTSRPATSAVGDTSSVNGRIAALNARANRLRRAVLTPAERQRLARGVAVPAAIR